MLLKAFCQRLKDYKLWLFFVMITMCITIIIPLMFENIWTEYITVSKATDNEANLIIKTVFTNYVVAPIIFIYLTIIILMEIRTSFAKDQLDYNQRWEMGERSKRCKYIISLFLNQQILIMLNIVLLITSILVIDIGFINDQVKNEFIRILFILMSFMIIYQLFLYPILFSTYFIVTKKIVLIIVVGFSILLGSLSIVSTNVWNKNQQIDDVKLNLYDSDGKSTSWQLTSQQLSLIGMYKNFDIFKKYFENNSIKFNEDKKLDLSYYQKFLTNFCEGGKTIVLQSEQNYYVCYQPKSKIAKELNKAFNSGLNQIIDNLMTSHYLSETLVDKFFNLKKIDIEQFKRQLKLTLEDNYDESYDNQINQNFVNMIQLDQDGISLPYNLHIPEQQLKVFMKNMFYGDLINAYEHPMDTNINGNTYLQGFYQYLDSANEAEKKLHYQWFNQFQWLELDQIKGELKSSLLTTNYSAANMETFIKQYIAPAILIEQLKLSEISKLDVERFNKQQSNIKFNKIANLTTHFTDFFSQLIYKPDEINQLSYKLANLEENRYLKLLPQYQVKFTQFHNGYLPQENPSLLVNANYYLIVYFAITLIAYGFVINRYSKYLILQTSNTTIEYLLDEITLITNKKNKKKKWKRWD